MEGWHGSGRRAGVAGPVRFIPGTTLYGSDKQREVLFWGRLHGADVSVNVEELHRDAEAGNDAAMFSLAIRYAKGMLGLPQDHVKALEWFTKADDSGNVTGMAVRGTYHVRGIGGASKDAVLGATCLAEAGAQGSRWACHWLLGKAHLKGKFWLYQLRAASAALVLQGGRGLGIRFASSQRRSGGRLAARQSTLSVRLRLSMKIGTY